MKLHLNSHPNIFSGPIWLIRNGDSKGNQTQIPNWQLYIGSSIVQWAGTQESNFFVFADCAAPGFYGNTWPTQLGWIFNKHEFMLWSRILWVHDLAKTVQSWIWFHASYIFFFRISLLWLCHFELFRDSKSLPGWRIFIYIVPPAVIIFRYFDLFAMFIDDIHKYFITS